MLLKDHSAASIYHSPSTYHSLSTPAATPPMWVRWS